MYEGGVIAPSCQMVGTLLRSPWPAKPARKNYLIYQYLDILKHFLNQILLENLVFFEIKKVVKSAKAGNTKGGGITVPLTSCLTGLESSV
jgi:hypothetical protein